MAAIVSIAPDTPRAMKNNTIHTWISSVPIPSAWGIGVSKKRKPTTSQQAAKKSPVIAARYEILLMATGSYHKAQKPMAIP
jgi:hypothetical protein